MSSESPNEGPYLGGMLRLGWQWVREQIFSGVLAAGYDDLNPAHVGLFRYPTLDRQRPSEVADQLQITKQSVNDLLGHLEQCGYLTREPDPADGRARVIRLTAKGRRLEKTINGQAQAAELQIAELLGPRRFSQLRNALEELARHVTRNDGPSPTTT
ncbi:MAG TPA: MarR family winged helix-turn-helix transcriptional regulator [Acidimicrobiia bacterium]